MSAEARRWLSGLAVGTGLLAVMVGAMVWSAAKTAPCPASYVASDPQPSLDEAFFQDPANQSAILLAMQACAK